MQQVTFVYKSPNSTRLLNDHIAKILAPGAYHGLEVIPTSPPSMQSHLTAGYALTDEGVKIEETLQTDNFITYPAADPNFPRIDLIVLRHRYDPTDNPNPATYAIIVGTPTPPPASPVARETIISDPADPLYATSVHPGDIVLADVHVPAACNAITSDLIFNRFRTLTTPELQAQLAEALFLAVGNFVYEGWDLTPDVLNVTVSPGRGLLCGLPARTDYDTLLTTLRAREYLYGPNDEHGVPYIVGDNLTLDRQPDYPSKLRVTVTCTTAPTAGKIYISGKNEFDEEINNEEVVIDCAVSSSQTVETISRYKEVYHEGIDAHELERAGHVINIFIKDKPLHYIYVKGTQSGKAIFKVIMDPAYHPTCDEYLLGWAETDELAIIPPITRWATTSLAPVIEDLSSQCDGSRRSFTLVSIPRLDTEVVVLDGATLMKNSPNNKGYTISNNVITLQSGVPTPDGPGGVHGSSATDLFVKYIRQA